MTNKIGTTSFGSRHKWIPALFITLAIVGAFAASPGYSQKSTATAVSPDPSSVAIGDTITYAATVTDTSASPTTPSGSVSWADGNVGGSFSNSGSCTLGTLDATSASCTVIYTPPSVAGTVTITATYTADVEHSGSSGTSTLTVSLRTTSTTVSPNPSTAIIGNTITYTATVEDISPGSASTPTGAVSWDDGGKGGSFSSSGSCTLASGSCTITYTPPSAAGSVTITATYGGDTTHSGSSGTSALTVNLRTSSTTVSPSPSSVTIGNTITFTATVADTSSGTSSTPTGAVSWGDGGKGGSFSNSGSCTLLSGTCTTVYTPPSTHGSVTITATYSGDPTHAGSSGTSSLTVLTPAQATQNVVKLVKSMNLPHGLTNSLDAKLRAAINSLNRGNPIPAKNQLNAFINEVRAQTGKKITSAQATQLIAAASDIIKALH